MKHILGIINDEFKNQIIDINKSEDEVTFYFEYNCEIRVNKNKRIDIYKRYVYCDDEDKIILDEQEESCSEYKKLLFNKFGEGCQVYDDSCIGCPAVDEIVGYFNKEFDIEFIRKFIEISEI